MWMVHESIQNLVDMLLLGAKGGLQTLTNCLLSLNPESLSLFLDVFHYLLINIHNYFQMNLAVTSKN